MKSALVSLTLLGALQLGACATDATDESCDPDVSDCSGTGGDNGKADGSSIAGRAQMNDLTIVVPLAKSQGELDGGMIAASTTGPNGALLPEALYTKQFPDPTGSGGIGSDVTMTYANLRVVAIRFDPCFAQIGQITDPSQCDNQLRLVFQSLTFASGGTSAIDGAVHAFYRLTRDQLTSALREVIALRRANGQTTAMGPLAPHPLLVKQGNDGAFGAGLSEIILKYASADNLIRFTHFQSSNLQTVWGFSGFDVANSATKPMVIPTLPGKATSGSFFAGFAAPIAGGFTPETTSKDDVAVLVNITNARAASKQDSQAAYDAALRLENPGFHSPNTIDCASCHIGQVARVLIGEGSLGLTSAGNPNVFKADPRFVSARSMKATTSVKSQSGINVHMLSYKNDALMIGQRVINETANTLAYVNGVVLR